MEKTEEVKKYLKFQTKLRALRLAEDLGCKYACEVFKISKTTFYNWKRKYDKCGEEGTGVNGPVIIRLQDFRLVSPLVRTPMFLQ
jgi:hypothetical protein